MRIPWFQLRSGRQMVLLKTLIRSAYQSSIPQSGSPAMKLLHINPSDT
jgi:hypothetical protein